MYHTRGVREDSKYNHTHRVDADVSRDLLQYQQSAMVGTDGIIPSRGTLQAEESYTTTFAPAFKAAFEEETIVR